MTTIYCILYSMDKLFQIESTAPATSGKPGTDPLHFSYRFSGRNVLLNCNPWSQFLVKNMSKSTSEKGFFEVQNTAESCKI